MARVTGILVKHSRGEAWDSRISLPGATRNLAKPQDRPDMAGGDGISDPGESQLHVHLAQIAGSPLAHFVSTPRSHLQSPTAPSFSLRNLARQSVTKMSAEGNPAPLRGAAKGEAPRYLLKRAGLAPEVNSLSPPQAAEGAKIPKDAANGSFHPLLPHHPWEASKR